MSCRAQGAAASLMGPGTSMVAVAIYSADPAFRLRLEQLLRAELRYTAASVTHNLQAVVAAVDDNHVAAGVAVHRRQFAGIGCTNCRRRPGTASGASRLRILVANYLPRLTAGMVRPTPRKRRMVSMNLATEIGFDR